MQCGLIALFLTDSFFGCNRCSSFFSHLGGGKAAQDKAVSESFSQDANTGQMTSGSQFTQSKRKNVCNNRRIM